MFKNKYLFNPLLPADNDFQINDPYEEGSIILPALHQAARVGDADTINSLLNTGTNVNNITYNGRTALHYATENNNLRVVALLINAGADTTITDLHGNLARNLLPDHGLQLQFDSLVANLHSHNVAIRADVLAQAPIANEDSTTLPYDVCSIISEYATYHSEARLIHAYEQQHNNSLSIFSCLDCLCPWI